MTYDEEKLTDVVFDSILSGVVIIDDKDHVIVDVNETAAKMIGLSKEDIIGNVCHNYICPAEIGQCPVSDPGQIIDRSERVLLNCKGESIPILKTVRKTEKDGQMYLIESFIDISNLKKANHLVTQKLEIERTVASISSMFVSGKDLDFSINSALEKICNLCGSSRSYIFLLHDDGTLVDNTHEYCPQGVETQKENLQDIPADMFPWWMDKLHNGESIHIKDVSALPEEASAEKALLEMQDIRSLIVLPLYTNNELAGFIGLDNVVNAGEWEEEDIAILRMTSHIIGTSLERKMTEKALRASEEKYSTLVEKGNDGIIILQDDALKYANKKMADLSGYSLEEIIGKPFIDFVSPNSRYLVYERYRRRLSGEEVPNDYEIEIISKNGKMIPVDINATRIEYEGRPADMAILRDFTDRKKAEESLKESEARFRTILQNVPSVSVMSYSADGTVHYWNEASELMYGYTAEEALGKNVLELIFPPEMRDDYRQVLEFGAKTGEMPPVEEMTVIRKDGSPISLLSSQVAILQPGKEPEFFCMDADLTERKKAEEAMLNAKLAAEAANRAKSEFLANMSHELRTPLNSIIGFSDVLDSENFGILNETQKHYLSNVHKSGNHLLGLINDLLDLSKIEAGKMEFIPEKFAIQDAINEIKATMIPLAAKNDIDLKYSINIEKPLIVADASKFKQILYNLVSNAIKFTDRGGSVTIGVNASNELVSVFVKDTGLGISANDQKKLFNPFSQLDSSPAREYGGTGLGLGLVRKFVEMHGGKVWVESEIGKGSKFSFTIPVGDQITRA